MKKIYALLFILTILLTACQKTPENTVVKSKSNDTYIDIVSDMKDYDKNDDDNNIESYLVNEKWRADYVTKVRKVKVKIDSNIFISVNDSFPVLEVQQEKISQELVDNFIVNAFDKDAILYLHNDSDLVTKSDYEKIILEYKQILSQEVPKIKDDSEREEERNFYESHIKHYIELMENAPLSREKILDEVVFSSESLVENILSQKLDPSAPEEERSAWDKDLEKEAEIIRQKNTESICFDTEKTNDMIYVNIMRSDSKYQNYFGYYSSRYSSNGVLTECFSDVSTLKTSYKDAKEIAQEFVSYLGVDYMEISLSALANDRDKYYCYTFVFTRNVNNIPETYASNAISGNEYNEPWPYENIIVMVDDEGIAAMHWQSSQSKIINMISEDAPLLEFEKIKEIAENQILMDNLQYNWIDSIGETGALVTAELVIDEIVLGYMRVKSSDSSESYNLIPVWDFFGYENINMEFDGIEHDFCSHEMDCWNDYRNSFLTINAIDGSIIDRSLGY